MLENMVVRFLLSHEYLIFYMLVVMYGSYLIKSFYICQYICLDFYLYICNIGIQFNFLHMKEYKASKVSFRFYPKDNERLEKVQDYLKESDPKHGADKTKTLRYCLKYVYDKLIK